MCPMPGYPRPVSLSYRLRNRAAQQGARSVWNRCVFWRVLAQLAS